MEDGVIFWILGTVAPLVHLLGVVAAVEAVMKARSAQGSVAWAIALLMLPYLSLPLYAFLGRSKFHGYVEARRLGDHEVQKVAQRLGVTKSAFAATFEDDEMPEVRAAEGLAKMPFTRGNDGSLLIDGDATFGAIFAALEEARDYVLVQFFIVKDDEVGRELKAKLIQKAGEGVRVYFIYDEIGSFSLPRSYIAECREAGIDIRPFHTTKGKRNRFQVNFRNHRKIVVVDGRIAFVGGLNVGDEYMGRHPVLSPWRDTHMRIEGPAVMGVQLAFVEDWYWAAHELPELPRLDWAPRQSSTRADMRMLVLPTGPADSLETCALFFDAVIHGARKRLWIASPYFVPDEAVVRALQLAGLRGVDVRIMLPEKADHKLVYLSSFSYLAETERAGVKIYRYQPGFLHQKVMLLDDNVAAVGTANLDNRSFRLNFEITLVVADAGFAREVETMLERDFANCRQSTVEDLEKRPFWFRVAVRFARLMAPIQ